MTSLSRRLPSPVRVALRRTRDSALQRRLSRAGGEELATVVGRTRGELRRHLTDRMATLLRALDQPVPTGGSGPLARAVETALTGADAPRVWLALAVLTGRLPLDPDVVETLRRLRLDGPRCALSPAVARANSRLGPDRRHPTRVEVLTGAVTVDLQHTSETDLATGIQRVARETARRWDRDHDVELVGWTEDYTALRRLGPLAHRRALGASRTADRVSAREQDVPAIVVPWGGTHLTVELATEEPRTSRMQALARYSGNRTGVIGFDCVPLTTAETAAEAMGGAFARLLAGVRHMDRVATISEGAAVEYRGWRAMLAGAGLPGPDVVSVPLPVEAAEPSVTALETARSRFALGSVPLVLVVGSHEPRKNHLAVLHAAELLWREGLAYSLVFVGGNSWSSDRFTKVFSGMRDGGRPVQSISALSDELLWAAYRTAHVVLFPSLNEGFGLPVAEALASGTPVITSGYGSMAEIAEHGGALLVDPRDDHDLAGALRRILTEPALHAELAAQADARPKRSWDTYADELWHYLVRD
ncbi:MAG: glycosyltransferase family 4 protein [Mycobacteriales bacterium]